jgi:hypothetical protein
VLRPRLSCPYSLMLISLRAFDAAEEIRLSVDGGLIGCELTGFGGDFGFTVFASYEFGFHCFASCLAFCFL